MNQTPKLTRVHRLDSIALDSSYFTEEGYFVDTPIVTSVGIFEYKNPDGGIRRELRLPEHVFEPESLASYKGKPVIITHGAGRVDKRNVEREIVGTILSDGFQDGEDARAQIIIHGINEVKNSGLRELSLGYDLVLDETPGEWNGRPYDAIQTGIRINHLALVGDARAGDQARLNLDGEKPILRGGKRVTEQEKKAMNSEELKTAIAAYTTRRKSRMDAAGQNSGESPAPASCADAEGLTGVPPNGEPQTATAEERVRLIKDRRDRRDQDGDPANPESAMGVIAAQDEDIGALLEIIEQLKAKTDFDSSMPPPPPASATPAPAASGPDCKDGEPPGTGGGEGGGVTLKIQTDEMDAIVRERLKLGRLGDTLNLDGLEDMKPIDAKKAVVKKVNPNMRLDGKGDAYINAAFDAAVAQLNTAGSGKDCNYQRRQMSNRADSRDYIPNGKTAAASAREAMIERQQNGGAK